MKFKKLILNGGGIRGIELLGAIEPLHEVLDINTIVGVSAGSLCSLGLVLGYTILELKDILFKFDLIKEKDISLLGIMQSYGINNCSSILNLICLILTRKGFSENLTFDELYQKTGIHFIVVVTNLSKHRTEYWCYKTQPQTKIFDAIRISINIPLYFYKIKFRGDYYVDGGITDNFPLNPVTVDGKELFDSIDRKDVLVIKISSEREMNHINFLNNHEEINDFKDYFITLISLMKEIQETLRIKNHDYMKKLCAKNKINLFNESIIFIENNLNISCIDFDLSNEKKEELYTNGKNASIEFLKNR